MKKNLRIVSAAAAALLAVAPVAATAVSTANAAIINTQDGMSYQFGNSLTDLSTVNDKATNEQYINNLLQKIDDGLSVVNDIDANGKTLTFNIQYKGNKSAHDVSVELNKYTGKNDVLSFSGNNQNANAAENGALTLGKNPSPNNFSPVNFTLTRGGNITGVDNNAYFTTVDGQTLVGSTPVVASPKQNHDLFVNASNNYRNTITIAEVKAAIESVVSLRDANGNKLSFKKNVWGNSSNVTTDQNLAAQLKDIFGAPVKGTVAGANDATAFNVTNHTAAFTLHVTAVSGKTAYITFQNSNAKNTIAPVVYGYYRDFVNGGRSWQPAVSRDGYVRPLVLTQNDLGDGSAWNASNYLRADSNATTKAWINASYDGNVDLTKAGVYNVTVTATNAANQTTKVTVPVIVDALNGHVMTVVNATPVYNINNGVATQATNFTRSLAAGSQVHVYGSVVTAKLNGTDTQFYRIVSNNANYYVPASALKDGVVNTNTNVQTVNKEIKHISTVYDKNGKPTHDAALRAYDKYDFVATPVTINGAKFYQMVENGKPVEKYIKVGNIDGTSRTLKHNSYVYKSNGKAYTRKSGKKTKKVLRRSGSSVTTYGKSFMIAGHQMYRVGHNQYIKKANF